jgi:hypothetical protein
MKHALGVFTGISLSFFTLKAETIDFKVFANMLDPSLLKDTLSKEMLKDPSQVAARREFPPDKKLNYAIIQGEADFKKNVFRRTVALTGKRSPW